MKKVLAIAGILALTITPNASFGDHLELKESEIRPLGNLAHTNLSGSDLIGANLSEVDLNGADLTFSDLSRADLRDASLSGATIYGITANNLRACPLSLPNGWVCENNSLIPR